MESPCHRGTELVSGRNESSHLLVCKACGMQYSEADAAEQLNEQMVKLKARQGRPSSPKT